MSINTDMRIGELVRSYPETVKILKGFGLGCVGCPSAQAETIGEAAQVHGLNVTDLINALNDAIAK